MAVGRITMASRGVTMRMGVTMGVAMRVTMGVIMGGVRAAMGVSMGAAMGATMGATMGVGVTASLVPPAVSVTVLLSPVTVLPTATTSSSSPARLVPRA